MKTESVITDCNFQMKRRLFALVNQDSYSTRGNIHAVWLAEEQAFIITNTLDQYATTPDMKH